MSSLLGPLAGVLHVSEEFASCGVSVDVQENPYDPAVQPATLESAAQLVDVVLHPTQQ